MFARKTKLLPRTGRTDRQTDRQTDRVRRNMRPPPTEEGRIKIFGYNLQAALLKKSIIVQVPGRPTGVQQVQVRYVMLFNEGYA